MAEERILGAAEGRVHFHVTMVHSAAEVRAGLLTEVREPRGHTDRADAMDEAKEKARRLADELRDRAYRVRVRRRNNGYIVRWDRGYTVERRFEVRECRLPECATQVQGP